MPHRETGPGRPGLSERAPTLDELRISARILLHISMQPRVARDDVPPPSLTQTGIAEAVRASQAAVSNALNRLVDGGALEVERGYVQHRWTRLKVYRLTARGELLVRQIRRRFGL